MAVAAEVAGDLALMLNSSDSSTQNTPAQEMLRREGKAGQMHASEMSARRGSPVPAGVLQHQGSAVLCPSHLCASAPKACRRRCPGLT